jgi:hypothetical protein
MFTNIGHDDPDAEGKNSALYDPEPALRQKRSCPTSDEAENLICHEKVDTQSPPHRLTEAAEMELCSRLHVYANLGPGVSFRAASRDTGEDIHVFTSFIVS